MAKYAGTEKGEKRRERGIWQRRERGWRESREKKKGERVYPRLLHLYESDPLVCIIRLFG